MQQQAPCDRRYCWRQRRTGLWLLAAVITGAVVHTRSARRAVLLTVGFHLGSGAAIALGRGYLPYRWPEMGARPSPAIFHQSFIEQMFR